MTAQGVCQTTMNTIMRKRSREKERRIAWRKTSRRACMPSRCGCGSRPAVYSGSRRRRRRRRRHEAATAVRDRLYILGPGGGGGGSGGGGGTRRRLRFETGPCRNANKRPGRVSRRIDAAADWRRGEFTLRLRRAGLRPGLVGRHPCRESRDDD